jgi:aminopeptidase N
MSLVAVCQYTARFPPGGRKTQPGGEYERMNKPFSSFLLVTTATLGVSLLTTAPGHAQRRGANPFAPPGAKLNYAPDRVYDLKHVAVTLNIDYPNRKFSGVSVNTLAPLRPDGLTLIPLMCGRGLDVQEVLVDGKAATFTRDGGRILITAPAPIPQGRDAKVSVRYTGGARQGAGFGGGEGGFHWINPTKAEPTRVGFWTQGETNYNSNWAPTWDYPNDFATSETITTAPADWTVIGNGTKRSDKVDKATNTRTVHWKMDQPHATYLLALVGGPLDVKEARWEGVPLIYAVPKGKGHLIDDSFGDTPDMLSFFSRVTGVKYPWPKYAQNAMYDFGGGMENVSSTTLGAGSLTDRRQGYRNMAGLNAHELAHQWFGDLVTCKFWGDIWLNESFATYFEGLYMEHSRGKHAYDWEMQGNMQGYFGESRRYKRPLSTRYYPDDDAVFDSHAYPKGGAVLHTLRRYVGDELFFASIKRYLETNRHNPVETSDLARAFTETTGINLQPWFEQWVYKPGHPVLSYSWAYEGDAVKLTVRQTQDTSDGTPVYLIPTKVGVIKGGKLTRLPITLSKTEETFTLKSEKPDALILDPDQDFLREIPKVEWARTELLPIVQHAPVGVDRTRAFTLLMAASPTDDEIKAVAEVLRKDTDRFPAINTITPLARLKREDLRPLYRELVKHLSVNRQAEAINALGELPKTDEDIKLVRGLVTDTAPYATVTASLGVLARWDPQGSMDLLKKAAAMPSEGGVIRASAYSAIAKADPNQGIPLLVEAVKPGNDPDLRRAAVQAFGEIPGDDPRVREALKTCLKDADWQMVLFTVVTVSQRGDKAMVPALEEVRKSPPSGAPQWFPGVVGNAIRRLNGEAVEDDNE